MSFRWVVEENRNPETCLDQMNYLEWVEFVFDRPTASDEEDRWYYLEASEKYYFKDPLLFLNRMTRLIADADLLGNRYSPSQIEQGFWCLISAFELSDLLEDKDLDLDARLDCIRTLEALYGTLFKRPGFENIAFQYLNPLTYNFHENKGKVEGLDELLVMETFYDTLCRILEHKDRISFLSAARGLSRLHHEGSAEAIASALVQHDNLLPGDLEYVRACISGNCGMGQLPVLQPPAL